MMSVWVDASNHMQCGLTGTTFLTGRGTTFSQTSNMTARTTGTSVPVGNPDMLIPLFAQRASAVDRWSIAKLYSCKMYNNSTIVRDFIPAKRISDGKCGLWDKVNFKFYTDENGGNFTAGAEKIAIAAIGTSIEYLEATGTQYINTNILASDISKVITDFQFTETVAGTESQIMAVWIDSNNCMQAGTNGTTFMPNDRGTTYSQSSNVLARTIATSTPVGTPNYAIYLFGQNQAGTLYWPSKAKIYSCKMYKNGKLNYDFIPIKTTTNIYGLWDKVNKIFYSNAGTGTFTGGPAVALTGWHKIKGIWAKTAADTWSQAL